MKYKMRDRIQFEYKGQLWTGTIISVPLSAKSSQTYVVSLDNYMSYQIDGSQIKTQVHCSSDTVPSLDAPVHTNTESAFDE